MPDHECLHEIDFGKIESHLESIAATQNRMEGKQSKVLDKIFGNGGEGLVTSTALMKQAIKRQWYILSVLILGLVTLAFTNLLK